MNPLHCRCEDAVARGAHTGTWDPGLLEHVERCAVCQGVRTVAAWVRSRVPDEPPSASAADARRLWRVAAAARARRGRNAEAALGVLANGRLAASGLLAIGLLVSGRTLVPRLTAAGAGLADALQSSVAPLAAAGQEHAALFAAVLLLVTAGMVHRSLAR